MYKSHLEHGIVVPELCSVVMVSTAARALVRVGEGRRLWW